MSTNVSQSLLHSALGSFVGHELLPPSLDVLSSGTIIVGQGPTSSVASGNDDDGSDDGGSDSDSTDLEMPPWQEEYLKRLMLREQLEKHPWKVYSCYYLLFSFSLSS